jgi:hypothetical protein
MCTVPVRVSSRKIFYHGRLCWAMRISGTACLFSRRSFMQFLVCIRAPEVNNMTSLSKEGVDFLRQLDEGLLELLFENLQKMINDYVTK